VAESLEDMKRQVWGSGDIHVPRRKHVCTCVYMCVHVCTCVYMCVYVRRMKKEMQIHVLTCCIKIKILCSQVHGVQ